MKPGRILSEILQQIMKIKAIVVKSGIAGPVMVLVKFASLRIAKTR
jgi:hypothetical protein